MKKTIRAIMVILPMLMAPGVIFAEEAKTHPQNPYSEELQPVDTNFEKFFRTAADIASFHLEPNESVRFSVYFAPRQAFRMTVLF